MPGAKWTKQSLEIILKLSHKIKLFIMGKNLHFTLSQTSNFNVKELRLLSKEMNNHTTLNNLNKR